MNYRLVLVMDRNAAILLVKEHVKKENNIKHMIAVGAVMRAMAAKLGEDQERWEIIGILHDIDFEKCSGLQDHTLIARGLLEGVIDHDAIQIIMAHNHENTGVALDTPAKKSLVASDAVSGLVVATALVMPSRKLADVKPESIAKKFKTKDFAKGCDRARISVCEGVGIGMEDFLALALEGMKQVSDELGL
jgi:predicted hydrolase (HD superfamily)